jgi:hypothetical protein
MNAGAGPGPCCFVCLDRALGCVARLDGDGLRLQFERQGVQSVSGCFAIGDAVREFSALRSFLAEKFGSIHAR